MKKLTSNCRLIISVISMSLIISCSKDMNSAVIHETPASKAVLNITATKWEQVGEGVYQCNFTGIMRYVTNAGNATVFLVADKGNEEINISSAPASFLNGEISAFNDSNNIWIVYKVNPGKTMPFSYLNLKIVFE